MRVAEQPGRRQAHGLLERRDRRAGAGAIDPVGRLVRRQQPDPLQVALEGDVLVQAAPRLLARRAVEPRGPGGALAAILALDALRRGGGRVGPGLGGNGAGAAHDAAELRRLRAQRGLPGRRGLLAQRLVGLHELQVAARQRGAGADHPSQRVARARAGEARPEPGSADLGRCRLEPPRLARPCLAHPRLAARCLARHRPALRRLAHRCRRSGPGAEQRPGREQRPAGAARLPAPPPCSGARVRHRALGRRQRDVVAVRAPACEARDGDGRTAGQRGVELERPAGTGAIQQHPVLAVVAGVVD